MVHLKKFPYKYFDYEIKLMHREITSLFPESSIKETAQGIVIDNVPPEKFSLLEKLTYIESFEYEGRTVYTMQSKLESTSNGTARHTKQQTRYSSNGLHEYKGKFNPQIVRSILNLLGVKEGMRVIDPFCGSGTTLLECQHMGIEARGIDINPLAVFIANAKTSSLEMSLSSAIALMDEVCSHIMNNDNSVASEHNERIAYLDKWLPNNVLSLLERARTLLSQKNGVASNFFKVILSDLIREYSFQEPSDLRIRKRFSEFPNKEFIEAFTENAQKQLRQISLTQKVVGHRGVVNCAHNDDIRNDAFTLADGMFDIAITSPPYATALPYIDTQRLSLVWLELCSPRDIMKLESTLIGSREMYQETKRLWQVAIDHNEKMVPLEITDIISDMQASISINDGFRKQTVPLLLYRYFADMKSMFQNVARILRKNAHFALVVGHNKTKLGEKNFLINTPELLVALARTGGWELVEMFPLQTYQRYGLNRKNAINSEMLIILRNSGRHA